MLNAKRIFIILAIVVLVVLAGIFLSVQFIEVSGNTVKDRTAENEQGYESSVNLQIGTGRAVKETLGFSGG